MRFAQGVGPCSLLLVACAACSPQPPFSPADSRTVYLDSADSYIARPEPRSHHKTSPIPAKARPSPTFFESTPIPASTTPSRVPTKTIPSVDDSFASLRERLLQRIEHLSNDEADQVCLDLELIPRERIFDQKINPKKLLLHHASQAPSRAELESIEGTINELRR